MADLERPSINSRLEGLRNLSPDDRRSKIVESTPLSQDDAMVFGKGGLPLTVANGMIENVFEALDIPNEWFFDAAESKLYLIPNATSADVYCQSPIVTPLPPLLHNGAKQS